MSEPRIKIVVDFQDSERAAKLLVHSVRAEGLGPEHWFEVRRHANIHVGHGQWQIDFHPPEDATWSFEDFSSSGPSAADGSGTIETITCEPGWIRIVDHHRTDASKGSYAYQIKIKTADGKSIWVDPVIENESGSG